MNIKKLKIRLGGLKGPGYAWVLVAMFAIGISLGSFVGCCGNENIKFSLSAYLADLSSGGGLQNTAFETCFYPLAAVFFATSYLGVFFIPALVFARAFSVGCTVSALYSCSGISGLACAAVSVGIPCLMTVPCMMLAASDSLLSSGRIFSLRFYSTPVYGGKCCVKRHFLSCLLMTLLAAAYLVFLEPVLASYLI